MQTTRNFIAKFTREYEFSGTREFTIKFTLKADWNTSTDRILYKHHGDWQDTGFDVADCNHNPEFAAHTIFTWKYPSDTDYELEEI